MSFLCYSSTHLVSNSRLHMLLSHLPASLPSTSNLITFNLSSSAPFASLRTSSEPSVSSSLLRIASLVLSKYRRAVLTIGRFVRRRRRRARERPIPREEGETRIQGAMVGGSHREINVIRVESYKVDRVPDYSKKEGLRTGRNLGNTFSNEVSCLRHSLTRSQSADMSESL